METRRIRRHARRHVYRTVALAISLAAFGLALGMALPRSTVASILIFAAAACCSAVVVAHDDAVAPLHGLHRVIRLPLRSSVSATFESMSSRVVGTLRGFVALRPEPTPLVIDEPDDEADEWWGTAARPEALVVPASEVPALKVTEPDSAAPVLCAPLRSARVPADEPDAPNLGERVLAATRRHLDALAKRVHRHRDDAGPLDVSAST
jgi:hypothetical protein